MSKVERLLQDVAQQALGPQVLIEADRRIWKAARDLVEAMYEDGEFGEDDRTDIWLDVMGAGLANVMQGTYEDWIAEQRTRGVVR